MIDYIIEVLLGILSLIITLMDSVTKYDIPYGGFTGKVSEVPWFFSDLRVYSADNDGDSVRIRVK